ncbi:MAG: hypothetical protein H0W16_01595 [Actinobacteria bacterium]|nr:hypothetical protein [Actinomycetota bacterium]
MSGVDALTGVYTLPCPGRGESRVRLSSFREIERLPGPAHPSIYRVVFDCSCGGDHVALVGHDALDWAPLGLDEATTFLNLMTSRTDDLATELVALASARIDRGEWPWSFFCYLEDAPRPVTPSSFRLLDGSVHRVAVAVSCPCCGSTSINLVTPAHVDVPFHSDRSVGVVAGAFEDRSLATRETFRAELSAAIIDDRRLELHA